MIGLDNGDHISVFNDLVISFAVEDGVESKERTEQINTGSSCSISQVFQRLRKQFGVIYIDGGNDTGS